MRYDCGVSRRPTFPVSSWTALVVLSGVGSFAACGGSTPSGAGDTDGAHASAATSGPWGDGSTGDVEAGVDSSQVFVTPPPAVHRASADACSHDRGPGDFDPLLTNAPCQSDTECTMGENGRCLTTKTAPRTNYCSYDTCFSDADCGGKVCTCRESPNDANRCDPGNCRVDADCGAGSYCSPSEDANQPNHYPQTKTAITGWWCKRVPPDWQSCADDGECYYDGFRGKCAYDTKVSHWTCLRETLVAPSK